MAVIENLKTGEIVRIREARPDFHAEWKVIAIYGTNIELSPYPRQSASSNRFAELASLEYAYEDDE